MKKLQLITANGEATGNESEGLYTLTVNGLPSKGHAQKMAVIMAQAIVAALTEVMGDPPGSVGTNDAEVAAASGIANVTNLEEFLEANGVPDEVKEAVQRIAAGGKAEVIVDDCQCPGCRARRADEEREAQLKSGTSSEAKH